MSFDWAQYLALARSLRDGLGQTASQFSDEAAIRCAVSRAYYAAFCTSRDFAERRLSYTPSGTGADHGRLREHLRRNGRNQLARLLGQLLEWRAQCDYSGETLTDGRRLLDNAINGAEQALARSH